MVIRSCFSLISLLLVAIVVAGFSPNPALAESRGSAEASYLAREQRINVLTEESRLSDALREAEDYLAVVHLHQGQASVAYATALSYRGFVLLESSRFGEATRDFQRALELYRSHDAPPRFIANALNNLGQINQAEGKLEDAERLYNEAMALQELSLPADDIDIATSLANLAHIRQHKGDVHVAERLLRRSLDIRRKGYPENHYIIATTLQNLATALESQRRHEDAERLLREAVRQRQVSQNTGHPQYAGALHRLGVNLYRQRQHAEAEELYVKAIAIRRAASGFLPDLAINLTDLAQILILQRRYEEAERTLHEALEIYGKVVPATHTFFAGVYRDLAYVADGRRQARRALELSRKASDIYIARRTRDISSRVQFQNHVEYAWKVARGAPPDIARQLLAEAFEIAQRAMVTDTELSVTKMTARLSARDPRLQALIRERQDRDVSRGRLEKELIATMAAAGQQARAAEIRQGIEDASAHISGIDRRLDRDFPDYQALVQPSPLSPDELQASLAAGEALVKFFLTYERSFVFAMSREQVVWRELALDPFKIADRVSELRAGLEILEPADRKNRNKLYDLARAHDLYRQLLGPVEGVLDGKGHLLIVASGAVTSLPFHALVTAPSAKPRQFADLPAIYARTEWLVRRQSVGILPSVGNVASLKRVAAGDASRKQLIGFGDPQFALEAKVVSEATRGATEADRSTTPASLSLSRGFGGLWRGAAPDIEQLRRLPRLPSTEVELKGVAALLGVPTAPIHLQRAASERAVRNAHLADYRIVYFATHALVAGELPRLAEPALALAVPDQPTAEDDGLLTASEVADLKLDADWVVLSACNTAAGNRQGAEALSGLAQAFFYAGSRALLVSHWAVDDLAAATLMVQTFDALARQPDLGRAGALRSAMLSSMLDPSNVWSAYPSFWAPFFVVGLNTLPGGQ